MRKKIIISFLVLFSFAFSSIYSQEVSVSGTVKDESGALAGVNVQVKGTSRGTTTDFDGNYKISASQGEILMFSSVGYKAQEVSVTGDKHDVTMTEDANQLDEVIITAFGIKKSEKSLGYAVQKVNADDLNLQGQTNALEALQGRISGVQINRSSGSVGGGVDILIRGITSVDPSRDNQPLIVVDGVALNNDTFSGNVLPSTGSNATGSSEQFSFSNRASDINPDDVESYNILKGAAATALYGIRASNGAIIITTKKGKLGKPKISVNTSTTIRNVVTTPELQKTFREGHRTSTRPGAVINNNEDDGYDDFGFAFYSWGVPFTDDSFTQSDGTVVDLTKDGFNSPYDLFNTGINTQINVSLSGADEKFDYYLSAGKSKDEGVLPNTEYNKTNFRFKGGYKVNDKFEIGSSIAYTKSGGSRGNGGDKSIYSSLSYWSATFPINDYINADGSQRNYSKGIIDNPRYFAETSNLKDNVNRWIGAVNLSYKVNDWVDISYSAQIDNYSDIRNRFVAADLDVGTQVGGFIVNENIGFTGLESNLLFTFTKDINEDLKASLLLGNQISDSKTNYSFIRGEGLNVSGINDIANTLNVFAGTSISQLRNVGVFGDLRIEYKNYLFLSLTGRNDWLSVMPPKNRSFFYPSVSASFILSEVLDTDKNKLSFAKIRASWAQVGKGPNFGQIGQFFSKPSNFPFNGVGGFELGTSVGDPDLVPERNNNIEIGTDLRFMNNRIRFDYSYFKNKVSDQIFSVSTPNSSGISRNLRNAGNYETWGHEFMLGGDIIKTDNFKWSSNILWSTIDGEVTEIPDDLDEIVFFSDRITAKAKVGDAIGTLYGWVFQTAPDGQRYVGSDGKWVVTGSENTGFFYQGANEMVKVGNAMPDFIASFNNTLTYKKLSLNFLLEWKKGGDLYDRGFRNALRNGNLIETEFRDQTRILEGVMDDGAGGFVPNTQELLITANSYYRDFNNYNSAAEVLLQDGSWLKLRTIGLTYNLGGIDKVGIDKLSISASGNNILLWTPFKGFDPESNQFSAGSNIYGFTGLTTPLSQSYSLGLKFEF
jgi:TonB-linked SusC/RagA family outer membrane protein